MTIQTNSPDRRELVKALSEHLGAPAVYQRMPSCAYRIGEITVERDGRVICPDERGAELSAFLTGRGFIRSADAFAETDLEATTGAETAGTDSEALADDVPTAITVILHGHGLNAQGMTNLLNMICSRQRLIREMLKTDGIFVREEVIARLRDEQPDAVEGVLKTFDECAQAGLAGGIRLNREDFGLSLPRDPDAPTRWEFASVLMKAMTEKAKSAKRINSVPIEPAAEEMKYCARGWLFRLGLGGRSYADFRHAMLDHLEGYAAFKSREKMAAHSAKYTALRRQRKEAGHESGGNGGEAR